MHLNWQFEIHPGELENSSQCLVRERVTPTGLQEMLAPEMLLNAWVVAVAPKGVIPPTFAPDMNNEGFFFLF